MIKFIRYYRGEKRSSVRVLAKGELSSWGLAFRNLGSKPTGVGVSFKPTPQSVETFEVEFNDIESVRHLYITIRDYLERHDDPLIK